MSQLKVRMITQRCYSQKTLAMMGAPYTLRAGERGCSEGDGLLHLGDILEAGLTLGDHTVDIRALEGPIP